MHTHKSALLALGDSSSLETKGNTDDINKKKRRDRVLALHRIPDKNIYSYLGPTPERIELTSETKQKAE